MVDMLEDERRPLTPKVADERRMLTAWLDFHRATLLLKCEGLDDEGLRTRPVPTSSLSLHGLVRHMAEVERSWFRRVLEGETSSTAGPIFYTDEEPDGDFELLDGASFADDVAVWQEECDLARAITAAHELDDTGSRRGEPVSLRWILVHMVEEYARHNGHADLIRELVDGAVGG
jgi:uncharacterized damage-inducible protein DinB